MYAGGRGDAGRRRELWIGTGMGKQSKHTTLVFLVLHPCGLYLIHQYCLVSSFPPLGPWVTGSTAPSAFVSVCSWSLVNKALFLISISPGVPDVVSHCRSINKCSIPKPKYQVLVTRTPEKLRIPGRVRLLLFFFSGTSVSVGCRVC